MWSFDLRPRHHFLPRRALLDVLTLRDPKHNSLIKSTSRKLNVEIKFDEAKGRDGSDDSDDNDSSERVECGLCQEFAGDDRSVGYPSDASCI